MQDVFIERLVDLALAEDIGDGDHSSLACISPNAQGTVQLMAKQDGVLAGMSIAPMIFRSVDGGIVFTPIIPDGVSVSAGDICFTAYGRVHSLLRAERVVLNIMQRMSGVATLTNHYVKRVAGTKARILDTRKTTPGMRMLDKMAVRIGGGCNHRMGLFDLIMLKDNHIDFAGGIRNAVEQAREYLRDTNRNLAIEVEARGLDDVRCILEVGGVQRIMLDNFSVEQTLKAVQLIDGSVEVESSGGITLDSIRGYAEAGVDYISVGALTHQIKSLDMNMKKI